MSTPFLPIPSATTPPPLLPPSPPSTFYPPTTTDTNHSVPNTLSNLGLGYAIAICFGFLVLLSVLFLSSYLCCRHRRNYHHHPPRHPQPPTSTDGGIILPRIIFVAEDDEENRDSSNNGVVGLHPSVINSYPKFQFSKKGVGTDAGAGGGAESVCSICLCEYKEGEMLRMMPDCKHFFHLFCLDAWLRLNGSCPVCRNSPLPTPLSTPLAEVVPLSQYPDNRTRRS